MEVEYNLSRNYLFGIKLLIFSYFLFYADNMNNIELIFIDRLIPIMMLINIIFTKVTKVTKNIKK